MFEFIDGNEAVARGALDAGCDFFAGYPITPSTQILLYMVRHLPERGGVAVQGEDELASIGFCIGASMTGRKVLTVTSGPGISLYSENTGLAIMGETPLVIVDVQRLGPATGGATSNAEGDIQFLRWITSGGYPIPILSPTDVVDSYLLTMEAFNFAEMLRSPVIVATSKEVAGTKERVDFSSIKIPPLIERKRAQPGTSFLPHLFESLKDTPLFSPYGGDHILRYTTSMHDETGYLTKDPEKIERMLRHFEEKVRGNAHLLERFELDEDEGAGTLIISYGVTARSSRDAVKILRGEGKAVSSLVLKTLFPVPERAILKAAGKVKRVVIPELNQGQYGRALDSLLYGKEVICINHFNGTLIPPKEIIERGGFL